MSITAVQPTTITQKRRCKKDPYCNGHTKRRYISHIAFAQNDIFIAAGFWSAAISPLPLLKHIYCSGFRSRHYRTPQKTIPIVAVLKTVAIDPMYSGGPKKRYNMRHIVPFYAPTAIVQISCSEPLKVLSNILLSPVVSHAILHKIHAISMMFVEPNK